MILQNIQTAQLHISQTLELLLVLLFLLYSGPTQHRILVSVRAEDYGSLADFTEHPALTSVIQQKSCDECSFQGKLLHSPGSQRCPAGPAVTYLGVICSRH